MKVLITGATGLVGASLLRKLVDIGYEVNVLVRNSADFKVQFSDFKNIKIFEGDILDVSLLSVATANVDWVIHSAAVVSFIPKDRANLYKTNVEGTANVVNACIENKVKKLLYVSSVAAFGRPTINKENKDQTFNVNEKQKWEDSETNSHYAISKFKGEQEVWRGMAEGLDVVVVNPSIIFGEGDWNRSSTKIIKYIFDEKPFYTTGFLNYIDLEDLVNISVKLLESDIKNERFCISAGMISYKDFFEKVASRFGKKAPSIEVKSFWLAIIWRLEALRSLILGTEPLITRETAISASMKIHYDNSNIINALDYKFNSLEKTLNRICPYFISKSQK
ncbi:MAG: NAD-dependent epimerase/dehydratase family protein [Bacteroidetes bacterium]|nr:NAD-dependent epimerase/dehydratase family protein [Bacteroidota bacterium]